MKARRENVERIIATNQKAAIAKLTHDKEFLEQRYKEQLERAKAQAELDLALANERDRRKREALEQEERERIAIMKVKAFEEREVLEEEIRKLKSQIDG